jgi:putative redox protein
VVHGSPSFYHEFELAFAWFAQRRNGAKWLRVFASLRLCVRIALMNEQPSNEPPVARLRYTGNEAFVAESPSGHAIVTGFSHGHSTSPSPMELVLLALGGCTGADVVSILTKKRQRVTSYEIEVRAERRDTHPRVYTAIEVLHRVRGRSIDPRAVARAVELSEEKYCSVSAMLKATATITSKIEVVEDE